MKCVLTAAQMREIDRATIADYAFDPVLLMEQAATATVRELKARIEPKDSTTVLVLCGPGNNGGDGAAIARQLSLCGYHVTAVLVGKRDTLQADAKTNHDLVARMAGGNQVELDQSLAVQTAVQNGRIEYFEVPDQPGWQTFTSRASGYDIVVDALFGTGLTRPLTGLYEEVVNYVNQLHAAKHQPGPIVVAVDLPSGLDADDAQLIGPTVQAHVTVTFTAPKPANILPPAARMNGELIVAVIGSPPRLVSASGSALFVNDESDARAWLESTRYSAGSYKNSHGHALILAGSRDYSGAPVLSANAAMSIGAGLVTVAVPQSIQTAVAARLLPEVICIGLAESAAGSHSADSVARALELATRADALAVGPGLSAPGVDTRTFVRALLVKRNCPMVIDADALNALSPWPEQLAGNDELPLILTPHEGEMKRLLGLTSQAVLSDRVACVRDFAGAHHVIVVLKGERIVVGFPDGQVIVNSTSNPGLGTAGTGDTLTGIITGCLAQACATNGCGAQLIRNTVVAAIFVAGRAADIACQRVGMRCMTASDVRKALSAAVMQLDPVGEAK